MPAQSSINCQRLVPIRGAKLLADAELAMTDRVCGIGGNEVTAVNTALHPRYADRA